MRKETINIKNRENKHFLIRKTLSCISFFDFMLKSDEFKYTGRFN